MIWYKGQYFIYFIGYARGMRWAWHVTRMEEKRNAYRLLVRKLEGRRPLGRPRRRCSDNIRIGLVEVVWGDVDWIGLAEDRDRWRVLGNYRVSKQLGISRVVFNSMKLVM
jgi:hypothetical protein